MHQLPMMIYYDLLQREEMTEDSDITCLGPFWCYKDLSPI